MRIEDSKGNEITSLENWATLYDTPLRRHQWKEHRSAYSVAEFILNNDGSDVIQSRVVSALGKAVIFERVIPELEVKFDEFGQGRVHDLGIFGKADSGESIFVGVEAKVDETFGETVRDVYLNAKSRHAAGISTNAPARIENLLKRHIESADPSTCDVRYQLLHATAGTVAADADISVFFVIVFKTALYNETKGDENYRDYKTFITFAQGKPIPLSDNAALAHAVNVGGKSLVCIYEYFKLES